MTALPESVPFLLVRPTPVPDESLDDAETTEIPSSKSVPPHIPPARVTTNESELPSVMVDLHELEVTEAVEAERASDVNVLLASKIDFPIFDLPIELGPTGPDPGEMTLRSTMPKRSGRGSRARGFAIALVAAVTAAGGTFAGLHAFHVTGGNVSHLLR